MKVKAKNPALWTRALLHASISLLGLIALSAIYSSAQTCDTASDLDDATRTAISSAAQKYFDMAAKGDTASLRQSAISSLASGFSGVEATVKERQPNLANAQSSIKSLFELESDGSPSNTEFDCGVFGKNGQTANSTVFNLSGLAKGKYAVVILEASSSKGRFTFSPILEQQGSDWRLGGLYITPAQVAGHDGDWFLARAREYKTKGQLHNAWFYYIQGRNLISPLSFMSTQATDKVDQEFQGVRPSDLPAEGKTSDLSSGSSTYTLTAAFPSPVGNDLDLIVKYQSPDASNGNQAYQSNVAVIKAMVGKYPELRDAFAAVVARAVDSSGRDYGTLLAMKDIK
ncbi:MAG TPA: hypothetical protein VKV39_08680 [Candidatus Sulfotelmatobacter sp.]|nr:hypothetical protein [Candidatus Sulfotelmatobacter sp.]